MLRSSCGMYRARAPAGRGGRVVRARRWPGRLNRMPSLPIVRSPPSRVCPVIHLVAIIVGVPLLATLAAWLLAGHEPRVFARRGLD